MTLHNRIFLLITIAWMILIFTMSAQPAPESTETSLRAGRVVCTVFVPEYTEMDSGEQLHLAQMIDHPVRKTAHATEYAILAILITQAFPYRRKRDYLICLCIAAGYAASDEFHQSFVPGRASMITDVLIDTCGAAVGLLIVWLVKKTKYEDNIS